MSALKELFTSGPGLMSVIGLLLMFGVGAYFLIYVLKHMREDEEAADRKKP